MLIYFMMLFLFEKYFLLFIFQGLSSKKNSRNGIFLNNCIHVSFTVFYTSRHTLYIQEHVRIFEHYTFLLQLFAPLGRQ